MTSQPDLHGSEIAWIPYRLRLAAKKDENSQELAASSSPVKVDLNQPFFYVHGLKLVEKPGATTTTSTTTSITSQRSSLPPQDTVTWSERGGVGGGGGGGGAGGGAQQTQYIRRLVDLRDDLLNQEETALARAVDRLRLHSINNKDVARYRLKLKDPGGESPRVGQSGPQGAPVPRPMMTTLEKFRQMRPQRRQPALFPLQGKQLIDSSSSVCNGSSLGSGTEDSLKNDTSAVQRGSVEDTVKMNLQRLMYPSSSIPNIGRKALRRHESLEPRTQQLQHVRHKVHKPSRPILASPFRLQPQCHQEEGGEGEGEDGGGSVLGSDRRTDFQEESSLPRTPPLPPAHKMGTMIDGDRLDMEKLNQYYYVYCLPYESVEEDQKVVSRFPPTPGGRLHPDGSKLRRTHSERPYNSVKTEARRPYSDRIGGAIPLAPGENPSSYKKTMGMLTGPDRISLPLIHASEDNSSSSAFQGKGKLEAFMTDTGGSSSVEMVPATERRKRHIVIDMPHILFSSATPDVTREPTLAEMDPHTDHPGTLSKALEQREARGHKELETLPMPEP